MQSFCIISLRIRAHADKKKAAKRSKYFFMCFFKEFVTNKVGRGVLASRNYFIDFGDALNK